MLNNVNVVRRHEPYTKFKAYLDEKNIKQSEVARLIGKSKTALNQKLNGTGGDFSISEIRIICNEFNISCDEFFVSPKVS